MTTALGRQTARLEAIAAARSMLAHDHGAVRELLDGSDDPRELAEAAVALSASLIALMPAEAQSTILDGLTRAAATG